MPHPFRFGVQSYAAESAKAWRDQARKAEDLGFSAFLVADHYLGPGPALAATRHPHQNVAAVPAIAVAAEATSTIRVGSRVMCVDYRNPVVLVKELATLDLFSEGRLELGLGAGWLEGEYDAIGVRFDPAPERIDRLGDVVRLVKAWFADGELAVTPSTAGTGVRAVGFEGTPKGVQRPRPPIMIGGGSPRVLRLAGAQADIVSFNFNNRSGTIGADGVGASTAAETRRKLGWVREGAGDRFDALELEIAAYFTFVTDRPTDAAEEFGKGFGLSGADMLAHPHALFGSADAICDELVARRERYGISYVTFGISAIDAVAPIVAKLTGT